MNTKRARSPAIWFCGDHHGEFRHLIRAVKERRPAAVVSLGDLQAQRPLEEELSAILETTEFWFIHGNHDTDTVADYDHLFGSQLADRNLDGRVIEVAGVRIAGLGGVFRERVWMPPAEPQCPSATEYLRRSGRAERWRGGLPLRHRSTIFPDTYHRLAGEHADVLVTHEAPARHPHGFEAVDLLATSMGVSRLFHGHHHDSLDYARFASADGFEIFGVGLCGITALDGVRILPGKLDAARAYRGNWS